MKLFGLTGIPKALVVLVTILLIASGLCGIATSVQSHLHLGGWGSEQPDTPLGNTLTAVNLISYAAFMISGLSIAVLLIVWPVLILANWLYSRSDRSQSNSLQGFLNKSDDDPEDPH